MPVEIKELIIRALLGDRQEEDENDEDPAETEKNIQSQTSQDTLAAISNMLKQEKER
jgi:hypothetical protein